MISLIDMKRNSLIHLFLLITILLTGCKKGNDDPPKIGATRTLLVYMAANNSLNGDAYTNLNQMESAYNPAVHGKLIVYARLRDAAPAIYEIQQDASSSIASRVVKTYPEHNSSDREVMYTVIQDMQAAALSSSYGLILWSHATSWHPDPTIRLKSFGDDGGETMEIQALKDALPGNLDFLLFDACSMASIEVLYELRDKAKYTVASPAEVISVGMPYDKMLTHLFAEQLETGLKAASEAYYQHYNEQSGLYRSATISLIDNRQLDKLAQQVASFLEEHAPFWQTWIRDEVQRLDFADESPTAGFDLLDFYNKNFPEADLSSLKKAVADCVLYQAHTPYFNGKPIDAHCGLSMYIPHADNEWVHDYYKSLDWYNASQSAYIFDKL